MEKGDAPADKKGGGRRKCHVCGSEDHFAHKHCGLCRSLEHWTCVCEERGAENGTTLAKINIPANVDVGLVAATTGKARGDGNEEWDLNSGASFYMSHKQARMTAYKKAPAGTTVEVADGTILPVDGSGTVCLNILATGRFKLGFKT